MANGNPVRCAECVHATLVQYSPYNPVIAVCSRDGRRDVANSKRFCTYFCKCTESNAIHKKYEEWKR